MTYSIFTSKLFFLLAYFIILEISCMISYSARDPHRYCSDSREKKTTKQHNKYRANPTKIIKNFSKIRIEVSVQTKSVLDISTKIPFSCLLFLPFISSLEKTEPELPVLKAKKCFLKASCLLLKEVKGDIKFLIPR